MGSLHSIIGRNQFTERLMENPVISTLKFVRVDEMFFRSACNYCERTEGNFQQLVEFRNHLLATEWYRLYVAYDNGDEIEPEIFEDLVEDINMMADAELQLRLLTQQFANTVVMTIFNSVLSLEALINYTAKTHLQHSDFKKFMRQSHRNKWLNLPIQLNKKGFETKSPPFEDFEQLIRLRNNIVHYTDLPELFNVFESEHFEDNTLKCYGYARNSIITTRRMIETLGQQLGITFSRILSDPEPVEII